MVSLTRDDVQTFFVSKTFPVDPQGKKLAGMKKVFPNLLAEIESLTIRLESNVKQNASSADVW